MKDHYSFLTPIYNRLTKLVFGDQLMLAKSHFAENLSNKKVLIIGGGDGLDYSGFQEQLVGEYWELSKSMLDKAKIKLGESKLTFHLGGFQAEKRKVFDEVWLHFVLDTMLDEEIVSLLGEIRKSVKPEGKIYLADFFAPKNSYQRFLNRSMITFFRIVTKHKRATIPDYEEILFGENWKKNSEKEFLEGWVKAQLWVKTKALTY
ncbi:class I SAM-dependent methyltransferase [Algoriphagus persicinus]|uniref:class I SAM-dependent methyltransferase n=1 Tax=Algoriphagus persicinus TaxID=3108754 RepID=UPI002B3A891C|nr:methyltransferase domain-containing protein [Algoriphagus sp. E1-3-M2]MEB2784611.1 methyltransferase domain-containing protein [Algoriphagus sp. E1-3-M2]